ncbi:MAG: hypothetical protein HC845_07810 [Akkermansiaceae bacterium]|nr:hypothetical protein [Akkermansiaceae bacterium]
MAYQAWKFGDDTESAGPSASKTYAAAGIYDPKLIVWDDDGTRVETTKRLEVLSPVVTQANRCVAAFGGTMGSQAWQRQTVTSIGDINGDTFSDGRRAVAFSADTALLTETIKGTKWFGAATSDCYGGTCAWDSSGTSNNRIEWRIQNGTSTAHNLHAGIYIDKKDFLNRGHIRPVAFDSNSKITIGNITRWENFGVARWLVREGDAFYVSEQTITPTTTAPRKAELSFINSISWANYNPQSSLDVTNPTFAPKTFQDVTAVGMVFDDDTFIRVRRWMRV